MSNITVTNLPVATSVSGSAQLMAVQSGTSVSVTAQQIANLNANGGTVTSITAQSPLSGGTITTTGSIGLNTNSITNDYLGAMAANTIKGNNSGSTAQPVDLTVTQTNAMLGIGNIAAFNILGNETSSTVANPRSFTLSAYIDSAISSTQGAILYRNATGWTALGPGSSGSVLSTNGASANPAWIPVAGTGTVTSIATGTGLTGGPITGSGTISIANTTVTANAYGSASAVGTFTVNAQGQLTLAGTTSIAIATSQITSGILPIANGGTGLSALGTGVQTALGQTVTGSGSIVLATSPTLVTPTLGAASATSVAMTTGTITTTPSNSNDIANKAYVDAAVSNVNYHAACNYATTADLGAVTYNNGSSGVGATITKTAPFATLAIDGANPSTTQRILVKNESNGAYNGIYTVTSVGSALTGWVLTRATDYDQVGTGVNEIAPGDTTYIVSGTTNAGTQWVQTTDFPITIGTTTINFAQIAGPGSYTAGTGLTLSGTQFSITNTAVSANSYGSSTAIPTFTVNAQGQLTAASTAAVIAPAGTLTGTTLASNVVSSSLTSVGTIATGVWNGTTIATGYGGTGLTTFTSGGAVYATSSSALTTGTLPITSGGTGQTTASAAFNALSPITTTGDLIIGNGTNSATRLAIGTNGYVLTSNGTTASWAAASGVTSFTAGTTGFTPSSATTGAITLAGTLNTANGGTGLTGFTAANNAIYSTSSSVLTAGTLPVLAGGTGVTTSTGTGSVVLSASPTFTGTLNAAAITATGAITDSIGNVRTIVQNSQTTGYTLVATDNGKFISITTGGVTVPASIFSAGQNIVIFNNSSSTQTITQGSGVTMTLAGSTTTGNRSLASYGVATVLCTASNTFVITGQGLT